MGFGDNGRVVRNGENESDRAFSEAQLEEIKTMLISCDILYN
jgi:hypothetical protein